MDSNREYISQFMTRSVEKSVEFNMLSDKSYIVPKDKIHKYVDRGLSIPYSEYLNHIKLHQGIITIEQLTQSSSFTACTVDMCRVLEQQGNPGMRFVDIGKLFPQYVKKDNDAAYRKYGENQVKTSAQLGLTFEYYGYWYLTCVGCIFNELDEAQQRSLLARTILRVPLYHVIITSLLNQQVDLMDYMQSLSGSTIGRRTGSILKMLNLCLDECRKEGIPYHELFYPVYHAKDKSISMALQAGYRGQQESIGFDKGVFSKERISHGDVELLPANSVIRDVLEDNKVRILVHNMMELHEGTTILKIAAECQREFQQQYFCMKLQDWLHLLSEYVRRVTSRSNLRIDEVFRLVA